MPSLRTPCDFSVPLAPYELWNAFDAWATQLRQAQRAQRVVMAQASLAVLPEETPRVAAVLLAVSVTACLRGHPTALVTAALLSA